MKKIALSFASSDGCTPNPPTPNQRRLPLMGVLNRTRDQRKHDEPERHPDERRLPVVPVVEAHGDAHGRQARARPTSPA